MWAIPPLAIKYLSSFFDGLTQNMFRYAVATMVAWGVILAKGRSPRRFSRRMWTAPLVVAFVNVCFQTLWAASFYAADPAFVAILGRTWVLFAIVLAVVLFPAERKVVADPMFLTGAALSLLGMVGVITMRDLPLSAALGAGVVLPLAAAMSWALYSIEIRRTVAFMHPADAFAVVSTYTTAGLAVLAFVLGRPSDILRASWWVNVVLVLSGAGSIGVAHILYYTAIEYFGVALTSVFMLATPMLVVVLSFLTFGERLTAGQMVSALMLLAGLAVVLMSRGDAGKGNGK